MVRGKPEHGFERDVPVEAPIVSEDKLVGIRVDVLAAQPMIDSGMSLVTRGGSSPARIRRDANCSTEPYDGEPAVSNHAADHAL
jgi:hypothetical protein